MEVAFVAPEENPQRWLPGLRGKTCGVAFDDQIVDGIPFAVAGGVFLREAWQATRRADCLHHQVQELRFRRHSCQ